MRTKFDKDLESGKVQGKYTFIPPLSTKELIYENIKDDNIKNISVYYDDFDENEQREVEEAVVLHLHNFNKSLIELERSIPKCFLECNIPKYLYIILDARRLTTNILDKELKEHTLINISACIS